MEEDLRQRDQRGLFQRLKSMDIEYTRKVSSQYTHNEEGIMLRDPGLVLRRWARFFGTLFNSKSDQLRLNIIEGLPPVAYHTRSWGRTDAKRVNWSLEVDGKREGSTTGRTSC